jgi:hypothetical protein
MKPGKYEIIVLIALALTILAVSGCTEGFETGTNVPTIQPIPTAETIPTPEPLPTAQALPTLEVSPVPRSTADPVIGTWQWLGENNTKVIFSFEPDGTFQRRDEGTGMNLSTGTWTGEGGGSYQLIYDTPGYVPEHIIYHPNVGRLGSQSNYFSRV